MRTRPAALTDQHPADPPNGSAELGTTRVRHAYDLVAVVVLTGAAYWARRNGLPGDGLWFDDSWVATGALFGRPSDLLTVGSGHPGFTALLMAIHRVGSGSTWSLGLPSLVAGVAAPPLLYVVLRSVRFERSVATVVSAALVVAPIHVLYAGRVKGYTLDTVLVLLLAAALPLMVRRSWSWPVAIGWAGAMIAVGTFSGYVLVASAAATGIAVLHPNGDRVRRIGSLAAQGLVQLVYLLEARTRTDLAAIEEVMEDAYDAHLTVSLDPRTMGPELLKHLRRVAEVFPGGSGRWLTIAALAALVGLVLSAFRARSRPEAIAGRYLLAIFGLALVGGLLDQFPFGPSNDDLVVLSPGGRHTLWLLPAFAFGLARIASELRRLVGRAPAARIAADAALVAIAVVLVMLRYEPAPPAPYQGSGSATRWVDANRRPDDLVVISGSATFSFANDTVLAVDLVPTPDHQVGYAPVYEDPNVVGVGPWPARPLSPRELTERARNHDRVITMISGGLDSGRFEQSLTEAGLVKTDRRPFGWSVVTTWERPPDPG
jgi:hypothetical protein